MTPNLIPPPPINATPRVKSDFIHPKGNPASDIWIIIDRPMSTDKDKGYCFSGGLGYAWDNIMKDAGIRDYYVVAVRPDLGAPGAYLNIIGELNHYQPRIIIPLDHIGQKFCDELAPKQKGSEEEGEEFEESEIYNHAGSILISPYLSYNHYVIPTLGPQVIMTQYKLRDQVVLDLAKAASELEYVRTNGSLQPLPSRNLKYEFESFDELLHILDSFRDLPILSNDIETIYPKGGTKPSTLYQKHPGYPLTIGLAPNKEFGISFDLFRESKSETIELWRRLNKVFKSTPQLGQNFFNFDYNFYSALGFEITLETIQDTLIRHHVLWPELPHKLQHLTRQYTREPYYKDEAAGWSIKDLRSLKRYNCLDVTVTYEVWEQQEIEFSERPWLR